MQFLCYESDLSDGVEWIHQHLTRRELELRPELGSAALTYERPPTKVREIPRPFTGLRVGFWVFDQAQRILAAPPIDLIFRGVDYCDGRGPRLAYGGLVAELDLDLTPRAIKLVE